MRRSRSHRIPGPRCDSTVESCYHRVPTSVLREENPSARTPMTGAETRPLKSPDGPHLRGFSSNGRPYNAGVRESV